MMSVGGSARRQRLVAATAIAGDIAVLQGGGDEDPEASPLTELANVMHLEPADEVSRWPPETYV